MADLTLAQLLQQHSAAAGNDDRLTNWQPNPLAEYFAWRAKEEGGRFDDSLANLPMNVLGAVGGAYGSLPWGKNPALIRRMIAGLFGLGSTAYGINNLRTLPEAYGKRREAQRGGEMWQHTGMPERPTMSDQSGFESPDALQMMGILEALRRPAVPMSQ